MSCSFVVVDKRRFDSPIVYASPTFCKLTGYSEQEVLGTNCRFLQAPHGRVKKGDHRKYTAPEAVAHLRNSLVADKECQTSMINYRKGGAAFINLVTVIPIPGGVYNSPEEADQIAFHVGFQVDLTEQPNAILQKLRDGTYAVNYSTTANINSSNALSTSLPSSSSAYARDWRTNSANMSGASKEMKKLLSDPSFMNSLPISTISTTLPSSSPSNERNDMYDGNKLLNLLLLEAAPDFVHVVSLKGDFLYVAPSVRRVLGYEPEDLVGKSLTHICHQADIVPLTRELKESSSTPHDIASTTSPTAPTSSSSASTSTPPKTVDLLFRVRPKNYPHGQDYVWLECRGRLHVEPGKGRKAIILSGRVRSLPVLDWGAVSRAFAISPHSLRAKEFWALLSPMGSFLFVGANVKDFLGWGAGEVIGKSIYDFLDDSILHPHETPRRRLQESISLAFHDKERDIRTVECLMRRKVGNGRRDSNEPSTTRVRVQIILFHPKGSVPPILPGSAASPQSPPKPLVCYFRTLDASSSSSISGAMGSPPRSTRPIKAGPEDVFEELGAERGSSWQYELQQLKIANQKLMDEVEELESSLEDDKRRNHESTPARRFSSYDIGLGISRSDWGSGLPVAQSQSLASLSLKRSWDASAGDPNAT
ncbi:hypothetical protein NLI96_g7279 [Meripilus lineatus]|uniref:PAS domain-containing protein n=1 Tax=Meripilus lineatus TaxID=2056292 RepID=A0AAD5UZH6_9APHY|nr:hypothetical protein NLI96_g7279 [Physisporinus lineatus]